MNKIAPKTRCINPQYCESFCTDEFCQKNCAHAKEYAKMAKAKLRPVDEIERHTNGKIKYSVRCIETGSEFQDVFQVEDLLYISKAYVRNSCNQHKPIFGLTFETIPYRDEIEPSIEDVMIMRTIVGTREGVEV